MKHKVGDTVRIRSKEWIDEQEKHNFGNIHDPDKNPDSPLMVTEMQRWAGQTAVITKEQGNRVYRLDIDGGDYAWQDWMFDPDYDPYVSLSAREAVQAMLDGETLMNESGLKYYFEVDGFHYRYTEGGGVGYASSSFSGLRRIPAKRNRLMTTEEASIWANSPESSGWMVRIRPSSFWSFPGVFEYTDVLETYQRARLLPDGSGVDEASICGFEVEVEE
jgi:hypothetical protein